MNSTNTKHLHILVVDDDQEVVEQVRNTLSFQLSCEVNIAYNGKEAVNKMEENSAYDLLILAILIPKLNGIEVCQEMIKRVELKTIPVLLISILPVTSDAFQKSLQKFDEFAVVKNILEKPFSDENLLTKVNAIINKSN